MAGGTTKKKTMRTLHFSGLVILAVIIGINLSSCDKDEDETTTPPTEQGNNGENTDQKNETTDNKPLDETTFVFVGTTWKCTASSGEEIDMSGHTYTFNTNGTVTTSIPHIPTMKYTLEGNTLTMKPEGTDIYMVGIITVSGNNCTYKYRWTDPQFNHECSMTLQKVE